MTGCVWPVDQRCGSDGPPLREVESGFRYTPTTCFETFPFPCPTGDQREVVAGAARELVRLRDGWLNPPGLEPTELRQRTLTNLYNARPTWLEHAHAALDRAVLAACGWPADLPVEEVLAALSPSTSSGCLRDRPPRA